VTLEIDAVYRAYFPAIREKCRRMLRDPEEAQDVAQETFIRLWRSGLATTDPRQVTAWVYTTSTRLTVSRLRSRKRSGEILSMMPRSPVTALDLEARLLSAEEVERVVQKIPDRELEVAVLHRVDGLTQPEVAEVTGSSERTVRRLLDRFELSLRSLSAGRHS